MQIVMLAAGISGMATLLSGFKFRNYLTIASPAGAAANVPAETSDAQTQTAVAGVAGLGDARFVRINLVKPAVFQRRKVRHEDIRAAL
jgi:hypothetical protein